MRYFWVLLLIAFSGQSLKGQPPIPGIDGTISFITSQNVYVKFQSTENISKGDTLFVVRNENVIPALVVTDLSSISCVCVAISDIKLNLSERVFSRKSVISKAEIEVTGQPPITPPPLHKTDSIEPPEKITSPRSQRIHGYLNIASYTNFSDNSATNSQRMKYTFSMLAKNIGNSNLSAECYISFVHSNKTWGEIQQNLFNGLKIYNLNLSYDFGKSFSMLAGRKINPKLSNMGANDGLQLEIKTKPVTIGIIAGFRPNYSDYGFNSDLFQYGAYLFNQYSGKNGNMTTTLAYVEQMNSWKTDRRFAYFQHINSLIKNLTFFGSVEVDLYRLDFNQTDSTYKSSTNPRLTNLYLSLNYRVIKQLTLSLSYNAMQNIIYYETYKSYLDKLLDPGTLQGYIFQVVYRPINKLSIGVTTSYRYEKNDPKQTKNLYGYVTYSQIPGINVSATASVVLLETSYLGGNIYGVNLSRDLVPGKLFMGINYRYVRYNYYSAESTIIQNVGELNLTWRIYKKISMSVYYEGTFEQSNQFNRIYGQLNLGF